MSTGTYCCYFFTTVFYLCLDVHPENQFLVTSNKTENDTIYFNGQGNLLLKLSGSQLHLYGLITFSLILRSVLSNMLYRTENILIQISEHWQGEINKLLKKVEILGV